MTSGDAAARLLFVSVRPQAQAAEAEYASFRAATRTDRQSLDHLDLVRDPLLPDALDRYVGVLIGGSPFNVTDPEADKSDAQLGVGRGLERLAAAALEGRTAAMFTCYGIGVATRFLGGVVDRSHPESTSAVQIATTAAGAGDAVTGILGRRFTALTAHKESTATLPSDAVLLATNEACPVQAYRAGAALYATQFHPEPTPEAFVARMTFYRDAGYFPADEFDAVAARVIASAVTEPAAMLARFAEVARA